MNSLSWFLYFADIVGNLQGLLVTVAILGGTASLMTFFGWLMQQDLYGEDSDLVKTFRSLTSKLVPVAVICSILAAIIPSRETLYLMAGSEIGESVVNIPEAKAIMNDI